jgi:hypothetical protein
VFRVNEYDMCVLQGREVRVLTRLGGVFWSRWAHEAERRAGYYKDSKKYATPLCPSWYLALYCLTPCTMRVSSSGKVNVSQGWWSRFSEIILL